MALTDAKVRFAKPQDRNFKLYDGDGLYLAVSTSGGRLWRFKYRFAGKEKVMSLGRYPDVGLQDARRARNAAKEALHELRDPGAEKVARKRELRTAAQNTFEVVAREWHEAQAERWSPAYAELVLKRFETEIFSDLGQRPIATIEPTEILATLKKVEKRGVIETTRRLRSCCSSVFRFAIAAGYCRYDAAGHLGDALKSTPKPEHYAALTRGEVGEFLVRLEHGDCEPLTRLAIKLVMLTAVRTKELRPVEWKEFEHLGMPGRALWRIPAGRMKMGVEHLVPLSAQVVDLLLTHPGAAKRHGKLFPGPGKEGVMSNNTMLFALYRLGYKGRATTHGFRGLFSTECNENGFNSDWVERQLAHDERDDTRAAYNAAQYLPHRRQMMQWWSDQVEELQCSKALGTEWQRVAENKSRIEEAA